MYSKVWNRFVSILSTIRYQSVWLIWLDFAKLMLTLQIFRESESR